MEGNSLLYATILMGLVFNLSRDLALKGCVMEWVEVSYSKSPLCLV